MMVLIVSGAEMIIVMFLVMLLVVFEVVTEVGALVRIAVMPVRMFGLMMFLGVVPSVVIFTAACIRHRAY